MTLKKEKKSLSLTLTKAASLAVSCLQDTACLADIRCMPAWLRRLFSHSLSSILTGILTA